MGDVGTAAETARALKSSPSLLFSSFCTACVRHSLPAITVAAGFAALAAALVACTPQGAARQPPPLAPTPESTWRYGAYLLSLDDAVGARPYLEQVANAPLNDLTDATLYLRDLTEARLFAGDLVGAAAAARQARARLAGEHRSAWLQADDRQLFERTIDALQAAAEDDQQRLSAVAADEGTFPSADAWYLLGWLAERHGQLDAARVDYRAFLERRDGRSCAERRHAPVRPGCGTVSFFRFDRGRVLLFALMLAVMVNALAFAKVNPDRIVSGTDSPQYDLMAKQLASDRGFTLADQPPYLPTLFREPGYPLLVPPSTGSAAHP